MDIDLSLFLALIENDDYPFSLPKSKHKKDIRSMINLVLDNQLINFIAKPMPYLLDQIHSAAIYSRPKEGSFDIVGHWGIVVQNKSGRYLVHNMPETGTVATKASDMSKNWKAVVELDVQPGKSISGMFKSTGLVAYLPQGVMKYVTQGFCTGAAGSMASYLVS